MKQYMQNTNPLIYFPEQGVYSWAIYDVNAAWFTTLFPLFYNSTFLIKFSTFHIKQPFFISAIGAYAFLTCSLSASTRYNATHSSLLYICAAVSSALFEKRHCFKTRMHVRTPQNFLLSESVYVSFLLRLEYERHETACLPTYISRCSSVICLRNKSLSRKCEFYGSLEQFWETVKIIKTITLKCT